MPESHSPLGEWLAYLEQLHHWEMELGLDRVMVVYRRLLPRGLRGRTVIVGGTNGKGSTVHALEQLLRQEACHTGAYTSPHIHRFNERIRIDGQEVDDSTLCRAFVAVEHARRNTPLTYFEFTTLAAFQVFQEAGVEFPLLEVGLGGRLDAVNIADPELAVITCVDLDHTQWLGEDRERIGFEKAGILRPGLSAIFGDPEPPESVVRQARAQGVALRIRGRDFGQEPEARGGMLFLEHQSQPEYIPCQGQAPSPAQQVALQGFRDLGFVVDADRVRWLVQRTTLPGRFELVPGAPELVLDVGHNPHAATWLAERMTTLPRPRRVLAVYAALADKDVEGVVRALKQTVDDWLLAGLDCGRGLSGEQLGERLTGVLTPSEREIHPDVATALQRTLALAEPDDRVLVFGSFHTVANAAPVLRARRAGAESGNGLHSRH